MTRSRTRLLLALVTAALLVLAACSSGESEDSLEAADDAASGDDAVETTDGDDAPATSDVGDDAGGAGEDTATDGGEAAGDGAGASPDQGQPSEEQPSAGDGADDPAPEPTDGSGGTGEDPDADPSGEPDEPAPPARPIVPRSGTYTYDRTVTDDEGSESDTTDSVVERLDADDERGRVRLTTESQQGTVTSDADVSEDGTLVDRSVIDSELGEIDCDWNPDWLLHGRFAEGSTWTFDSECSDSGTGFEVDVAISGSGAVVGSEDVEVDGETVTTWLVETTTVTEVTVSSATINGSQRSESESRSWIDPSMGMAVRTVTQNDNSGDFENGSSEVVTEFVRFSAA